MIDAERDPEAELELDAEEESEPPRPRLADRDPEELRALVLDVVPDDILSPPPAEVPDDWPEGLAPPKSDPEIDLGALEPEELAELVIVHASHAQLVASREVQEAVEAGVPVDLDAPHDVREAARGAMVEKEREEATAAAVAEANAAAPSAEEVEVLYVLEPEPEPEPEDDPEFEPEDVE